MPIPGRDGSVTPRRCSGTGGQEGAAARTEARGKEFDPDVEMHPIHGAVAIADPADRTDRNTVYAYQQSGDERPWQLHLQTARGKVTQPCLQSGSSGAGVHHHGGLLPDPLQGPLAGPVAVSMAGSFHRAVAAGAIQRTAVRCR